MIRGGRALFEGLRMLGNEQSLWPSVAVPVLLMFLGVGTVAWLVGTWTPAAFQSLLPAPESGVLFGLYWGLVGYVMLVLFAAGVVSAWALSTLLATPFYDRLAVQAEALVTGQPPPPVSIAQSLGDAWWSILHTAMSGVLFGALGTLVGFLALVPALDLFIPFIELALTALFVARELVDFPISRHRLSYGQKLRLLWADLRAFFGLGAVATALLWIPVLNLVVMPAAVIGATLLVTRGPPGRQRPADAHTVATPASLPQPIR